MLQKLAYLIATALLKAAIDWLKDPANREDIETAGTFVASKIVTATPWKWDDKIIKAVSDPAAVANQIVTEVLKRIPILGGR